MVVIRRAAAPSLAVRCQRRVIRWVRCLAMTAVIPAVFVLRFYATTTGQQRLRIRSQQLDIRTNVLALHTRFQTYIEFLETLDFSDRIESSDIVELFHCNVVGAVNWTDFLTAVDPLLEDAVAALRTPLLEAIASGKEENSEAAAVVKDMQEEFLLELLEQYVSVHGFCDYSKYRPTVTGHTSEGNQLLQLVQRPNNNNQKSHRLAIVISAFHDVEQLAALIEAIHQPQHSIVIHLERNCPAAYRTEVAAIAALYWNVVIVQFGTVVYRTDSLSMINLRILRWLTIDLKIGYEHAVLLDGSAFPLVTAEQLVTTLQEQHRAVWLGELTHKGQRVLDQPADHLLRQKRLIFTRTTNNNLKLHKRLPKQAWSSTIENEAAARPIVPKTIRDHMVYKSTSGNQGIYSKSVILQLLNSDTVMELFALSKYGCCCCLEERNWIAALSILGYREEALEQTSMFQAWGGDTVCEGTMNNAVLSKNASLCYRSEDPARNTSTTGLYFQGDETWDYLVDAKRRGFLFARKFQTESEDSMELMRDIRGKLWDEE
jgi:Core-2/I-Branching enzyme